MIVSVVVMAAFYREVPSLLLPIARQHGIEEK